MTTTQAAWGDRSYTSVILPALSSKTGLWYWNIIHSMLLDRQGVVTRIPWGHNLCNRNFIEPLFMCNPIFQTDARCSKTAYLTKRWKHLLVSTETYNYKTDYLFDDEYLKGNLVINYKLFIRTREDRPIGFFSQVIREDEFYLDCGVNGITTPADFELKGNKYHMILLLNYISYIMLFYHTDHTEEHGWEILTIENLRGIFAPKKESELDNYEYPSPYHLTY